MTTTTGRPCFSTVRGLFGQDQSAGRNRISRRERIRAAWCPHIWHHNGQNGHSCKRQLPDVHRGGALQPHQTARASLTAMPRSLNHCPVAMLNGSNRPIRPRQPLPGSANGRIYGRQAAADHRQKDHADHSRPPRRPFRGVAGPSTASCASERSMRSGTWRPKISARRMTLRCRHAGYSWERSKGRTALDKRHNPECGHPARSRVA
jgi:hypothetical protein